MGFNKTAFFDAVRVSPFRGSLTQEQVDGIESLLDVWGELYPDADPRWIANSLAQIHRETGGRMVPVREAFADTDEEAMRRLEKAWNRGRLTWVKRPYWRDGFFGRGHIQLTHEKNYLKLGKRIGVDLVARPELALDPRISAKVAIIGMMEGLFTGRELADYFNDTDNDDVNARRIVNGPDGSELVVRRMHRDFLAALKAGGYEPGCLAPAPEKRKDAQQADVAAQAPPPIKPRVYPALKAKAKAEPKAPLPEPGLGRIIGIAATALAAVVAAIWGYFK